MHTPSCDNMFIALPLIKIVPMHEKLHGEPSWYFCFFLYGVYLEKAEKKSQEESEKSRARHEKYERRFMGEHRRILEEHADFYK